MERMMNERMNKLQQNLCDYNSVKYLAFNPKYFIKI